MALLPWGSKPSKSSGGGTSFVIQSSHTMRVDNNTIISGIAPKGTADTTASWTLIKLQATGNNLVTYNEYRATDAWTNALSANYTLVNQYNI